MTIHNFVNILIFQFFFHVIYCYSTDIPEYPKQFDNYEELYNKAINFKKKEQYIQAVILFNELLERNKSEKWIVKTYYQLANIYGRIGDIENSVIYYNLVIKKLDGKYNNSNQLYLIYAYINNALNYIELKKIAKSIEYCDKAELVYNHIKLKPSYKFAINRKMANIYNQTYNLNITKSFFYLKRSLKNVNKNDLI